MENSDGRSRQQRRQEERKGIGLGQQMRTITGTITPTDRRENPTDAAAWGGKLNIYVCDRCRGHTITRDVDEGVTPFMIPSSHYCPNRGTPACVAEGAREWVHMTSSFYRVWDQSMREDWQWYRPGPDDIVPAHSREHVGKGGLLLRRAVFD